MQKLWKYVLVFFLGLVPLAVFGQVALPDEVIGEINGIKVTRADLEKGEGNKLLQARYQAYLSEQQALDDLIDNRLLELEAKKQNVTVEKLLDQEVNSKVVDPSEDQLHIYYDDLGAKDSYESLRSKILERIRQRRVAKARAEYILKLRTHANILITLAPPHADFTVGDAPRLGPADARVRLVEFADFECPYCAKVNPEIAKLRAEFGDKVSVYYMDLPLSMHGHAKKAAEAARCAGDQGKYWEYHDLLFSNGKLDVPQLKAQARDMKLDGEKFDKCLDSGAQAAAVQNDATQAQQLGLSGTPAFFLNGHYFSGALDYSTLRELVQQQLGGSKSDVAQSQGN